MASIQDVIKSLEKMKKSSDKVVDKAIKTIAIDVYKDIQKKTATGKDVKGGRFTTYSKMTKKLKRNSSVVNLRDSGDMLNDFKVRRKGKGTYQLGFSNSELRKRGQDHQNGTKKLPKRKWVGISKKSRQAMNKTLVSAVKKLARFKL